MCCADQQTSEISQGENGAFVLFINMGCWYHKQANTGSSNVNMLYVCQIVGFSWENCGKADDPAVMKSLDLSPDPINIPGDLTASASGTTSVALESPLSVSTIHTFTLKPGGQAEDFLQDVHRFALLFVIFVIAM